MNQEISRGIQQLAYNPAEVLVFNGEEYKSLVTKGTLESGKYIVAHSEKKSYSNGCFILAPIKPEYKKC